MDIPPCFSANFVLITCEQQRLDVGITSLVSLVAVAIAAVKFSGLALFYDNVQAGETPHSAGLLLRTGSISVDLPYSISPCTFSHTFNCYKT